MNKRESRRDLLLNKEKMFKGAPKLKESLERFLVDLEHYRKRIGGSSEIRKKQARWSSSSRQ